MFDPTDHEDYESIAAESRGRRQWWKGYRAALAAHPDPRDPDWPGHELEAEGLDPNPRQPGRRLTIQERTDGLAGAR